MLPSTQWHSSERAGIAGAFFCPFGAFGNGGDFGETAVTPLQARFLAFRMLLSMPESGRGRSSRKRNPGPTNRQELPNERKSPGGLDVKKPFRLTTAARLAVLRPENPRSS
jgi:hypothetical protein